MREDVQRRDSHGAPDFRASAQRVRRGTLALGATMGLVAALACTKTATTTAAGAPAPSGNTSVSPPTPDPRVGLRPGRADSATRQIFERAAEASWNMRLVSNSP